MKFFFLIWLTICLISCQPGPAESNAKQHYHDSLSPQQSVVVEDSTSYDPDFIRGLSAYAQPIQLKHNLIITGNDTAVFPENPELNKEIIFKAEKDQRQYYLKVKRTNLTNLDYEFQLKDKEQKILDRKTGTAVLGSMFFLAAEVDEAPETGEGYLSNEYTDRLNQCMFSVRIGAEKDPHGKLRATITYRCDEKSILDASTCPTLRSAY